MTTKINKRKERFKPLTCPQKTYKGSTLWVKLWVKLWLVEM